MEEALWKKIRVAGIIKGTMADGPGIRDAVYFQGCPHDCPGCHNPQTHNAEGGKAMFIDEILDEIESDCVTISGGDPFFQLSGLELLCKELKARGKNIWVYTGFRLETIQWRRGWNRVLKYIDVLVDGPYEEDKPETKRMCGSTNQRIIHFNNGLITNIE